MHFKNPEQCFAIAITLNIFTNAILNLKCRFTTAYTNTFVTYFLKKQLLYMSHEENFQIISKWTYSRDHLVSLKYIKHQIPLKNCHNFPQKYLLIC